MPSEIEIRDTSSRNGSADADLYNDVVSAVKEVSGKSADEPSDRGSQRDRDRDDSRETRETRDDAETQRRGPAKDERGRFAKKATEATEKPVQARKAEVQRNSAEDDNEAPDESEGSDEANKAAAPAGGPPPSWSVKSKAAWEAIPAEVRADIIKREGEVAQGLSALRDYKDLKPYAEMATKQGTTIKKALDNYVGIENVLKQDIGKGLGIIVQNYGLDRDRAAALFANLAQQYGGHVSPSGQGGHNPAHANAGQPGGQPQPGDPLYNVLKPFIDPLNQQLHQLQSKLTSREEADRNASQQSLAKAIESFSTRPENRYFHDLEESITRLFETGYVPLTGNHEADLRTAYDLAVTMNPDIQAALIEQRDREKRDNVRRQEQEQAEKAKKASRSITGSQRSGTVTKQADPNRMRGSYDDDLEADVMAAVRLHRQF